MSYKKNHFFYQNNLILTKNNTLNIFSNIVFPHYRFLPIF